MRGGKGGGEDHKGKQWVYEEVKIADANPVVIPTNLV